MDKISQPNERTPLATEKVESRLKLLVETGLRLASESRLEDIVRGALEAGLKLCDAAFGAFFYHHVDAEGERFQLYDVLGVDAEAFAKSAIPRVVELFAASFAEAGVLRFGDIEQDARYAKTAPFVGVVPVKSYLVVPVRGRDGEIFGALVYGHGDEGCFAGDCEDLIATVASQAAVAMDNVRLAENVTREIRVADTARQLQRQTADRLEQVLESTTDGVTLLDRNWRFTYINRYANELVAPGRQLVGTYFWDLFPNDVDSVFHRRYTEAMNGTPVEFTEHYAPLKMWAYVRVFPTPEGIAIFFQDVTKQKVAELEMAESAARLRQALDAGQLGTWTWDRATDLLDFDARGAELFGVMPGEKFSRAALREKVVVSEDIGQTARDMREALESGGYYQSEYRIATPEGTQRWISSSGIGVYKPGTSELTGMSGTVQDITARKTQEATLRQSEKLAATGRLAATIAHEINNPLEAVTNLIYLSKTDPTVPAPVVRLLETADTELERVAQIAQQTLGFYRDTTRPIEIDMVALLSSVVDLFSRKLLTKKLACKLDLEHELRIFGLQGEIKQVFSNLLVNAIEASAHNTTIRIRGKNIAHGGKRGVSVLLTDQGSGIPHDVRQRLFSPFMTTKQSTGTGLGLWVTRGIIEKQGGCIGFRTCTNAPSGTVFRVFLPAKPDGAVISASTSSRFLQ